MTKTLFTDAWEFSRSTDAAVQQVRLPHDAMIEEPRSSEAETGNHGGYFPGGLYTYRKQWTPPLGDDTETFNLFFEGVQGETTVLVNGTVVAANDEPYREFTAPLTTAMRGEPALIEVRVDNRSVPASRWYTGSGIYRPVWLEASGPVTLAHDGVRITTQPARKRSVGDALVSVDVDLHFSVTVPSGTTAAVEFLHDGSVVAREALEVTGKTARTELSISDALLWSAAHPNLYDVRVTVEVDGYPTDEYSSRIGLRTVEADARRGLLINGQPERLRGTAVHHDNGPLGAATFAAAEYRRARLLKEAGFNAIRSAHNPLSRSFLDACDELGLYVLDELTDVWYRHKTTHDQAARFRDHWRDDLASMIAKDRNRPSVIMYSIGNEISEATSPEGLDLARDMHRAIDELDPTRPTTIAVNPLLAMMAARSTGDSTDAPHERKPATSTAANLLTAKLGKSMVFASTLPAADKATRALFQTVDVAGYNYGYANYRKARRQYPDRIILGTESMPGDLPAIWRQVEAAPGVIGDFSWTGWDYLGEVGLGYWTYGSEAGGIAKPYPGVVAGCGIFDITGAPGAPLLLAQAVWDVSDDPGIAVRPLDRAGQRPNKSPWRSTDGLLSWSWRGHAERAEIEVYSGAQQVELFLNGRSLGRRRPGRSHMARFRATYEPGTLSAVAYRNGREVGRRTLRSAGPLHLTIRPESLDLRGPDDLAYVWIELADHAGTVDSATEDRVSVNITGPAALVALANASPAHEDGFTSSVLTTHRGRALAILRGTPDAGTVTVTVSSERHGDGRVELRSAPLSVAPSGADVAEAKGA